MAGVNLLKQLAEDQAAEEVAVSSSGAAFADLSSYEKTKLVLILVGFFVFYFGRAYFNETYLPSKLHEPEAQIAQLDQEIASESAKREQLASLEREAQETEERSNEIRQRIAVITRIKNSNRDKVLRMVDYIINQLPDPVWVSEMQVLASVGSELNLRGFSTNYQNISSFFAKLEGGVFFNNWELVETSRQKTTGLDGREIDASIFQLKASIAEAP
jgi:Tfp pilus assembly protein PilN